jgi:hypothetical protein
VATDVTPCASVPLEAAVILPCASTVILVLVYEPAVTAVSANLAAVTASSSIFAVVTPSSAIEIVPVEVIVPPVNPPEVATDVTPCASVPLDAAVILPCASTVILVLVYEPAVTAVSSKVNVIDSSVVSILDVIPVPPTIERVSPLVSYSFASPCGYF